MKKIPLSQGEYVMVSDCDFESLSQHKWSLAVRRNGVKKYAQRQKDYKTIMMHRVITDAPKGMEVDHIDGNGLNNQRENLRVVTPAQNQWNVSVSRKSSTGLKGAYVHAKSGKFVSQIFVNKKPVYLGIFDSKEKAHDAYCKASMKYHGEFARN